MSQALTIKNEDAALAAIKRFLEGEKLEGSLDLQGWPKLRIRLTGDKFDSTITPSVMKSFIELQDLVYKSYAQAQYGSDNTRLLSREEKSELEIEIEVKVEEGSSIYEVDFQEVLLKFAEKAASQMTPEMIAVTVLGLGVLWAGKASYSAYLNYRKEVRLAEVKNQDQHSLLQGLADLSKEETKRTQILQQAIINNPVLRAVELPAYNAKTEMLKGMATAETAEVSGVKLDGDLAGELAVNAKRSSVEKRLDGYYRIVRVDSSDPDEFKVKVRQNRGTLEFEAVLQDSFLDAEKKEILQYAEWERTTVFLSINAKVLEEKIKSATILDVTRANQPE